MKQKITKSLVDELAVRPDGKDFMVFDTDITGFTVRVLPSGAKRFALQYNRGGRVKRLPLGLYGEITVFEARKKALIALGELTDGRDPVEERQARIAATRAAEQARKRVVEENAYTLQKLIEDWTSTGLKAAGNMHKEESPRAIAKLLAAYLERPARELTGGQVQRALDDMAITSPVMALRTRNYGRAAFNWAVRRKRVEVNPFATAEVEVREKSRERVLTDAEIGEAWRAMGTLRQPWRAYLRVALLSLQRRGEVAEMEWSELSPDFKTWTLPAARAKNKKPHIVHLPEAARLELQKLPRFDKSPYVFTTAGKAPISDFTRAKRWLDTAILKERAEAKTEMPPIDWTVHDFRRTGVTVLAGLGFPVHVADKLLNHVQGSIRGVAAVYQRNEFLAERARALEAWAAYVIRQAEGKPAGSNVVNLVG
jgi:integrase